MPAAVEILQSLGAERQRDGSWRLDLRALQLTSLFGGALQGDGVLSLRGDDVVFVRPAELALCEGLSLRGLQDGDGLRELIGDLHGDMRARANAHMATLRRLGFKPVLSAPVPRPRADVVVAGATASVSINGSGQLVVDAIDGADVAPSVGTLSAAAGLVPAEALRRIGLVVEDLALRNEATNVGEQLSQDDLDELHNALHDELDDSDEDEPVNEGQAGAHAVIDDDDDDDYEPTVAGVPPPQRRDDVRLAQRGDASPGQRDWDGGTAPTAQRTIPRPTQEQPRGATLEVGTAEIMRTARPSAVVTLPAPASVPGGAADRGGGLLDEFDDDDDNAATASGGASGAVAEVDDSIEDDGFEFVDDDDSVSVPDDDDGDAPAQADPLRAAATEAQLARPPVLVPAAATTSAATPHVERGSAAAAWSVDDEEDDLLAALGGGADEQAGGQDALAGRPTTISVTPRAARDLVSEAPAQPVVRSASKLAFGSFEPPAALVGRPAPTAAPPPAFAGPPPSVASDDDVGAAAGFDDDDDDDDGFAGAKTRALAVDVALLDRLKRGDGQLPPMDLDDGPPAEFAPHAFSAGFEPAPGGRSSPQPADDGHDATGFGDDVASDDGGGNAAHDADGFDSDDVSTRVGHTTAGRTAVSDVVPPAVDVGPRAPTPHAAVDVDEDVGADDELAALYERAAALRAELDDVQARIAAHEARQESTATRPAPTPTKAADGPFGVRPLRGEAVVAAATSSLLASAPVGTDEGNFAPVGRSVDEIEGDGVDSATTPHPLPSPTPEAQAVIDASTAAHDRMRHGVGHGTFADDRNDDGDLHAAGNGVDDDGDGVSLADLQGALREMGVGVEDDQGTQVKPIAVADVDAADGDDGDVFGSGGAGGGDGEEDLLVDEPTNVRPPRPGTIALVVEDARARDRLRKHLEPRFSALFEAGDAQAASDLDELDDVDAIVFVRPSRSEPNQQGFARIGRMPRRPRVLVISADAGFDEQPGVDLRLPLGQKASEVARQVLEGLERLGVQAAAE